MSRGGAQIQRPRSTHPLSSLDTTCVNMVARWATSAIKDRERAFWILQDTLVHGIITIFIDPLAHC